MHNDNLRHQDFGMSCLREWVFFFFTKEKKNLFGFIPVFHIQYRLDVRHIFPLQRWSFEVYCLICQWPSMAFVPTSLESSVLKVLLQSDRIVYNEPTCYVLYRHFIFCGCI